jgi:hypothetical protein
LNNADLVTIASEERNQFSIIHAAKNGALADLESIQVQDWQHGTRLSRVDVFNGVP